MSPGYTSPAKTEKQLKKAQYNSMSYQRKKDRMKKQRKMQKALEEYMDKTGDADVGTTLIELVSSKFGSHHMGDVKRMVTKNIAREKVVQSAEITFLGFGKYHKEKTPLLQSVSKKMSAKEIKDVFPMVTSRQIKYSKTAKAVKKSSQLRGRQRAGGYARGTTDRGRKLVSFLQGMVTKHLETIGYVSSGSTTETWRLPMTKGQAYSDFRNSYIQGLQDAAVDNKWIRYDFNSNRPITRLQVNLELILRYIPGAKVPDWNFHHTRALQNQERKIIAGTEQYGHTICVDGDQTYRLDDRPTVTYFDSFSSTTTEGKVQEILYSSSPHPVRFRPVHALCYQETIDLDITDLMCFKIPNGPETHIKSYINDQCINLFFLILDERHHDVMSISSFWYTRMLAKEKEVNKFKGTGKKFTTRGLGRFAKGRHMERFKKILFPLNVGLTDRTSPDHWLLGVVELDEGSFKCRVYDSMSKIPQRSQIGEKHTQRFSRFVELYLNTCLVNEAYTCTETMYMKDSPQQINDYDCGVMMCQFAEVVSGGSDPCSRPQPKIQDSTEYRSNLLVQIVERTFPDRKKKTDEEKKIDTQRGTKEMRKRKKLSDPPQLQPPKVNPCVKSTATPYEKQTIAKIAHTVPPQPPQVKPFVKSPEDTTTPYEKQRSANIAHNTQFMISLGITSLKEDLGPPRPAKVKPRAKNVTQTSRRRSQRLQLRVQDQPQSNVDPTYGNPGSPSDFVDLSKQNVSSDEYANDSVQSDQTDCSQDPEEDNDTQSSAERSISSSSSTRKDCDALMIQNDPGSTTISTTHTVVPHKDGTYGGSDSNFPVKFDTTSTTVDSSETEHVTGNDGGVTKEECKGFTPKNEEELLTFLTTHNRILPCSYKGYWEAIANSGMRYNIVTQPYKCSIHEKAPQVKREYERLHRLLHDENHRPPEGSRELAQLSTDFAAAEKKYKDTLLHEEQYKTQRRYLESREEALPPRSPGNFRVIVYEDFVSQYNKDGKKVNNLVFTIKWRDEQGILRHRYLDNFCSDRTKKADSFYVRKVWSYHLRTNEILHTLEHGTRQSDGTFIPLTSEHRKQLQNQLETLKKTTNGRFEFEGVTHILRTGDSGGHFHSRATMFWESGVYFRTGILWETHTLCKRHAYSLCDAHGGAVKRSIRSKCVEGEYPTTAEQFAEIVNRLCNNNEAFANARAYAFKNISRDHAELVWSTLNDTPGMKKCCEFQYNVRDSTGRFCPKEGAVRMRICSESDEIPKVFDMHKRSRKEFGTFCGKCAHVNQNIVYHKTPKTECPYWSQRYVGRQAKSLIHPRPRKSDGLQVVTSQDSCAQPVPRTQSKLSSIPVVTPIQSHTREETEKELPLQVGDLAAFRIGGMSFGVGKVTRINKDDTVELQWYGNQKEVSGGVYYPAWFQKSTRQYYYRLKRLNKGHSAYTTENTIEGQINTDAIIVYGFDLTRDHKISAEVMEVIGAATNSQADSGSEADSGFDASGSDPETDQRDESDPETE